MKMTFQLKNESFEDSLSVSINKETKELTAKNNQISFDVDDGEAVIDIEYVRNEPPRINNPIGRFFANFFYSLLSVLIFFADNDNGIGIHKFFHIAKPYNFKKTLKITPAENIEIKFIPSKYNKTIKNFSLPDIEITRVDVIEEKATVEYNSNELKREFRLYHYPAYTLLFSVIFAIVALMIVVLVSQFSPFNLVGVLGMSFCLVIVLALLIVFACLFGSTHRLFKQIDCNLKQI